MPRAFYSFFFSSRRRHTRCSRDWSSDVCSSDLVRLAQRSESLGDALERLAGFEGEPHLAGSESQIGAGVQLQRLGLGVAQALGDVVDRETRILQQPVGIRSEEHTSELQSRLHLV